MLLSALSRKKKVLSYHLEWRVLEILENCSLSLLSILFVCGCPISESVQGQAGGILEQRYLVSNLTIGKLCLWPEVLQLDDL